MPVPGYPKVLVYGHSGTESVFTGPIIVEEKIDGSQIGFGWGEDGVLCIRSHNQQIPLDQGEEAIPKMFRNAVAEIAARALDYDHSRPRGSVWIYGEYLEAPKHNVLGYERIPCGHIALFDALLDGRWIDYDTLAALARALGFDVVPLLFRGLVTNSQELTALLESNPLLGGAGIEGVVIKNYRQLITVNGQVRPIFAKIVNEQFKENHAVTWGGPSPLEAVLASVASEARWAKAVQRRAESGELLNAPQDIGPLLKTIRQDFEVEEAGEVGRALYRAVRKEVLNRTTNGFPQWYKERLAERADGLAGLRCEQTP